MNRRRKTPVQPSQIVAKTKQPSPPARKFHSLYTTVLFLSGVFIVGCLLSRDIGITWDEPFYIYRAMNAAQTFQETAIQAAHCHWTAALQTFANSPEWKYYPQIPFLQRYIHGLFYWVLSPWAAPPLVFRAASLLLWCLMLGTLFLLARRTMGPETGWLALFLGIGCPRLMAHGFLATTESFLLAFWFLCVWVYVKCLWDDWPQWLWGITWGIALMAKFQVVILLPILALWSWSQSREKTLRLAAWGITLGPALFFILQPCYWLLFGETLRHYFEAWVFHKPMSLYFLGKTYGSHVPWFYAPTILLVTIPLPCLILAFTGAYEAFRSRAKASLLFSVLALTPLFLTMSPNVPKYDGERLFIQAYPAMILLAAQGGLWLWTRYPHLKTSILASAFAFSVYTTATVHPFYMEYYNALVGGAAGAAKMGFETSYWTDAINKKFLEKMNGIVPVNGKLLLAGFMRDTLDYEKQIGWLREDIQYSDQFDPEDSYLLIYARQGAVSDPQAIQTLNSEAQVCYQGVPIVKLVKRRPSPPG